MRGRSELAHAQGCDVVGRLPGDIQGGITMKIESCSRGSMARRRVPFDSERH